MVEIISFSKRQKFTKQTAARSIKLAAKRKLTEIFIVGTDAEGNLFTAACPPDLGNVLVLMELAKKKLLSGEE